jgi:prepilin-type N-terminal cleavage/methylation domain-containing protein
MKKGFTLIELLAVIVILSVVSVITTYTVISIINDSKSQIYQRQVEMLEKASEFLVGQMLINQDEIKPYIFLDDLLDSGHIKNIPSEMNGAIRVELTENGYQCTYVEASNTSGELILLDEDRTVSEIIVSGKSSQTNTVQGKNLIDSNKIMVGYNSNGGNVTTTQVLKNDINYANILTYIIRIDETKTYFLKLESGGSQGRFFFYDRYPMNDSSITSIGGSYVGGATSYSIAPVVGSKWLFIVLTRDKINFPIGKVQLEIGTSATDYEDFIPQTPTTAYRSDILNVSGNIYADDTVVRTLPILREALSNRDTFEVINGSLNRNIGEAVLSNTLVWNDWNATTKRVLHTPTPLRLLGFNSLGLSNFSSVLNNSMGVFNSIGVYEFNQTTYWYPDWNEMGLSGEETMANANQGLQEWLTGRSLKYNYVLATPTSNNQGSSSLPINSRYIYTDSVIKPNIEVIYQ